MLLTTHYMEEAERLCDRLAIIDHGRILAEDSPRRLVAGEVEPNVIEVRTGPGVPPPVELVRHARLEAVDGVWHCHTDEPGAVLAVLQRSPDLEYLHRPANLEDVFLRLTGGSCATERRGGAGCPYRRSVRPMPRRCEAKPRRTRAPPVAMRGTRRYGHGDAGAPPGSTGRAGARMTARRA